MKINKNSQGVKWGFFMLVFLFLMSSLGASEKIIKLYDGPSLSLNKIVTLRVVGGCARHRTSILKFDGMKIKGCNCFVGGKLCELHFLPGEHELLVALAGRKGMFVYNFLAGHRYQLRCKSAGSDRNAGYDIYYAVAYFLDRNSKKEVGDIKWRKK